MLNALVDLDRFGPHSSPWIMYLQPDRYSTGARITGRPGGEATRVGPVAGASHAYVDPADLDATASCLHAVDAELQAHVLASSFPCVAAKSAFNRGGYRFGLFDALGSTAATADLWSALRRFGEEFPQTPDQFVTFVAVFQDPPAPNELGFEAALWRQLQALHTMDAKEFGWADEVGKDPQGDDFSFSVGGRAFFIVGMHPHASRLSRRTPHTTVVFNLHEQFEQLRANGKYDGLQQAIRRRDEALQGNINPVLAGFGESSEARQYSGRAVSPDWRCPFHAVNS